MKYSEIDACYKEDKKIPMIPSFIVAMEFIGLIAVGYIGIHVMAYIFKCFVA